ncbi:MAG: DUF4352 domain-containing protein [Polyangiaceae bacterium]|nr:DUF4352 domain-containing protein [Polyangiaceae bacterium]
MKKLIALGMVGLMGASAVQACGDSGDDGDDDDDGSTPLKGVVLTPEYSVQTDVIDGLDPAPNGSLYILVDLSIENRTSESISLSLLRFSVVLQDGVQYQADVRTEGAPDGCQSSASLTEGSKTRCSLVFVAPPDAVTDSIVYTMEDGDTSYDAPLETSPCALCDSSGHCFDLWSDSMNCGACGVKVGSGTCVGGAAECNEGFEACGGKCLEAPCSCVNGVNSCSYATCEQASAFLQAKCGADGGGACCEARGDCAAFNDAPSECQQAVLELTYCLSVMEMGDLYLTCSGLEVYAGDCSDLGNHCHDVCNPNNFSCVNW